MQYVIHYEICAAAFMFILVFMSALKKGVEDYRSNVFHVYWLMTFLGICLDVISCFTITYHDLVPLWLNYLLISIFLLIQLFLPTLFMVYMRLNLLDARRMGSDIWKWIFYPPILGTILLLLNIWTKFIFYFDETGYHHGSEYWYLYGNAILCAIGTIAYVIYARKYLKNQRCIIMICTILVSLVPYLIQYVLPDYRLSGVGISLSMFMIYVTSENMSEYIDQTTGALNRNAMLFHMLDSKYKRMPEQVFIIALDNFKMINEMYGMDGGNRIMQMLVDGLQEVYSEAAVYRFGGDNFVVVIEERTEGAKELDRIRKVIGRKWLIDNNVIEVTACVGLVHSIHHDEEDLFHAMEFAVAKAKQMGKGQFFEVDENAVKDMSRKAAIEHALVAAIESGRFEVHYQPIYDSHSGVFHSMEALARLRVEGYGYVSPEEFITIAEQNGTIVSIGLLVLEEVCRFIKQFNLQERNINFVEVNLSTVQCMQDSIYQDIMDILERYSIPPSMINLEITESAAAYSDDLLIKNMARISLTDITFSLDDYGSGYSNVNYLVDLPFSIVKIDKYIIWAAMKKVTSRKILENMIAMFKAIDLKVVAEGIEDMEMADMVINMGVDYLQGYYFSKPVPEELLIERLEKTYLEKIMNV